MADIENTNRQNGVVSSRLLPGWVVTGTHARKGDVIGRIGMITHVGGILLDLDDGRICGFGSDEVSQLRIIEEVDTPYEIGVHGEMYLTSWSHACGGRNGRYG